MTCKDQKTIWPGNYAISVPCGKCIPCLINKRADWSFRLQQEHKVSESSFFITLTFDPKHCPRSLDKAHLQNYLKRLRKQDGTNSIRYYAVGEYGGQSGRPHYHVLLFNAQEGDARSCWRDSRGRSLGMVHVGTVTMASIQYCTKYIVQPDVMPEGSELQKPFSLMSRKYGIGAMYLTDEMIAWHREDDRNYAMLYDQKTRLPRFYREKIWPLVKSVSRYSKHWIVDRDRVSKKAMELTLSNQEKERDYYRKNHGLNWERVMLQSRDAVLSRVKQKVAYTQHL